MNQVRNKTVAITGASRGIGEAAARHFAEAGAHVVLAARSEARINEIAQEIKDAGGAVTAIRCDVSKAADVEALINTSIEKTGAIDVLINNAGTINPIARLADSDPEAWCQIVDVNLKGVYHGLRYAIPKMVRAGGGTIINISSGAATSALEGWSHYCATKAAVLSLTRVAHKEYGDHGVRVVGLSPGTVATDMQVSIKASGINPVSQLDPDAHIPPEWVARALMWLCGAEADRHLGTDFSIKTDEGRAAVGLALEL
ncbi:SDR family oxidoreductase [Yoonia litorea]|uniref:NADP-dependent 3-hydroxy acid dehydrogenase YdfG n=1 Tax=Yoonia litorea TaxID=1123755 RepID=A0A1I6MI53_9RHOB|nr:SDR family oxidoreductase [Yoonia litorea]SFS15287.1 NADP-dependent 3-hydroxy acid dehydrogenase YdfG [Yoonia litorea]